MDTDVYVADYTKRTNNAKGVVLSLQKPDDIESFHLQNRHHVNCLAVNFEEYPRYQKAENCECMFVSINPDNKSWMLFVELKYCLEKNIPRNVEKAYSQVFATKDAVLAEISRNARDFRIYLNVSVPDHSNKEPFTASIYSQNDLLNFKKMGFMVLGQNELEIMNSGRIRTNY